MRNDLIKFRKDRRMSQSALARCLGVNQATISRIERGKPPSGPVALLLAQLMGEHLSVDFR
ncbi:helix-turn-helix transcriptional regulator [Aquamicrobium sp.]|uniref:helix-turn-helix transcriptional regulator n=1 Tax=Aquamicrobium sp. TaxID=1872579 RepID=UPI00338D3539